MRAGLGVIAVAGLSACMPYALPPMRTEMGVASPMQHVDPQTAVTTTNALHLAVGASLASMARHDDFDIGVGYFTEMMPGAKLQGAYVDASRFVANGRHARFAFGTRVEARTGTDGPAVAMKLRVDAEVYGIGSGAFSESASCGAIAGVYSGAGGLGVYAEAGPAMAEDGMFFVASAGVSVRIPPSAGVIIGLPGCR